MACWQTLVCEGQPAGAGKAERNKFSDWRARIKWKSHNTHTGQWRSQIGRASETTRVEITHEDQMHPWRGMRNHITWSPGRTFESLCVSVWLFARSAKQNWPLRCCQCRCAHWLPGCFCLSAARIDLARFSAFSILAPTWNAKTRTPPNWHQPLSNWRFSVMAFYRETLAATVGDVCVVHTNTNFIEGWGGAWNVASCCAFICLFCVNISAFERTTPNRFFSHGLFAVFIFQIQ